MARHINYPSTLERLLYALITLFFALCACCGLGGCKKVDKPNVTDWAQICVRNMANGDKPPVYVRSDDRSCEDKDNVTFIWLYVNQRESNFLPIPGVGRNVPGDSMPADALVATTKRPDVKVIGRVPYGGGLGTATP
jgi:hypothetical protein